MLAFPQSAFAAPVAFIGMFLLGPPGRRAAVSRHPGRHAGGFRRLRSLRGGVCGVCAAGHVGADAVEPRLADPQRPAVRLFHRRAVCRCCWDRRRTWRGFWPSRRWPRWRVAGIGIGRDIALRRERPIRNIRFWLNLFFALFGALTIALCLARAVRDSSLTSGISPRRWPLPGCGFSAAAGHAPVGAVLAGVSARRRCVSVHSAVHAAGAFGHLYVPDLAGRLRGAGAGPAGPGRRAGHRGAARRRPGRPLRPAERLGRRPCCCFSWRFWWCAGVFWC